MVSLRCKMYVISELEKLKIPYLSVELGEVKLSGKLPADKEKQLQESLMKSGLEIMENKKAILIEKIKAIIIEMVHYADELPVINFSNFISEKLNHDYTYLANIFSETKGITIEQFIILHKIEKVKELLIYDELTLTEISYRLNYSSISHLSTQFKKITGLTPTYFKSLKNKRRSFIENV